jgi:penicillin amidase
MKNFLAFLFFAILTSALVYVLNTKIMLVPPVGKLLNPFGGFWQNAENEHINFQKQVKIGGLQGKVTVQYDQRMVPHIFAENEGDLFMVQGFVTAQHRLWQMEFQTMAAAGRISEIIGTKGIHYDRYQRRIGMVYGAEKSLDTMLKNPATKLLLESYAKGVNAYIQSLQEADLPIEYKLLDYKPETWTTLKSALLLKSMSYNLSGAEKDFEYTNFLQLYGREMTDLLFPDFADGQVPVVDKSPKIATDSPTSNSKKTTNQIAVADMGTDSWNFVPLAVQEPKEKYTPELYLPNRAFAPNPDNGSNNWAVSGKKTASGYPILCNDPHLELNLPSIWYEVQLHCPTINSYGVSLPGTPAIIIGFNDSIAWGVTNAKRDVMDWYKIRFKDEKREEYLYDKTWQQASKKIEIIKVRTAFSVENPLASLQKKFTEIVDTVIYTQHGMVTYDQNYYQKITKDTTQNITKDSTQKQNFALRWIAHDGGNELQTFYALNKAKNYTDFQNALEKYACPAQNFVFASVQNDIAMQIQGKFPAKWQEQGKFILDGAEPTHTWQKYIPTPHLVKEKNPIRGFVSSANQHPVDKTYPYYTFDYHYEYYRNRRINNVLDTLTKIDVAAMMKLQNDNFNLVAAENLPFLLEQLDLNTISYAEKKGYEELIRWNYYNDAKLLAPIYFEEWINTLLQMVYADEFAMSLVLLPEPDKYVVLQLLRKQILMSFWDNKTTSLRETPQMLVRMAFATAVAKTQTWKQQISVQEDKLPFWANYKKSSVEHLAKIPAFSEFFMQTGGYKSAVNASSKRHGVSWRMIVALNPQGIEAYGVYPGGQSGNVGSKYYTNLLQTWKKGEYFVLQFFKNADRGNKGIIFVQNFQ